MVYLQAWVWLFAPDAAFACTSGTGKNVIRDSRHARDLVGSPWYRETFRPAWRVGVTSSGKIIDNVETWVNSAGGERISIPWLSSWTGVHVDFLLGDDPDDAKKVKSTAHREDVRETYDRAMGNRLKLGSVTMMLQQHVHADDLTSNLKLRGLALTGSPDNDNELIRRAKASGSWTIEHRKRWAAMVLPIEFSPARRCVTPWGWTDWRTEPGEVLFAEQWTPEVIEAEKERLTPAGWNAQGNQDPASSSTGELERGWFRWCVIEGDAPPFRHRPSGCQQRGADGSEPTYVIKRKKNGKLDVDWLVVSVDPKNGSKRKASSNLGLVVIAGKGNMRFVLDDRTRKLGWLDTIDAIKELVTRWGPDAILIEEKAQGEAATETLRKDIADAKIKGPDGRPIVATVVNVEGGSTSFEDRWNAALPSFRAGLVYLLDGAEWNEEYVDELTSVPNGAKDDRADATCQAINHYAAHDDPRDRIKREVAALSALAGLR
jgi:predicted phage terminase large subunit-like protein